MLQKGRQDEAIRTLSSVRTKEDSESGWVDIEILGIKEAIESEKNVVQNNWLDLFKGTNRRRTRVSHLPSDPSRHGWMGTLMHFVFCLKIAAMAFVANQWTGNQFVTAYAPTLYVLLGRKSEAFTYTVIKSVVSMVAVLCTMIVVDKFGRRFVVIFGSFMQCIFLYLLGGMGIAKNPTVAELNTMVAAIQIFIFFCRASSNAMAFLIPAEVSSLTLRKKSK